jgi:lipoprotein signal peptidase
MDISGTVITIVTLTKISIATCSLGSSTKVMRSSKFVNWLSLRNTGLFTVQLKT